MIRLKCNLEKNVQNVHRDFYTPKGILGTKNVARCDQRDPSAHERTVNQRSLLFRECINVPTTLVFG